MIIYDITPDLFETALYPGDPEPFLEAYKRMEDGSEYNLSGISM